MIADTKDCLLSHMGIYAIEPLSMRGMLAQIRSRQASERAVDSSVALKADLYSPDAKEVASAAEQPTVTAVIPFHGPITKKRSKFAEASAVEIRALVRAMARDASVSRIVLHIDSPGGAVEGIDDLAQEVAAAAKLKPVVAYIEDLGASAAYWVASQATTIIANRSAFVGSLGVYGVLYDSSGAAAREGVKVHVISTGGVKGAGIPGAPVTEAILADEQRIVDEISEQFQSAVRTGRGFTKAATKALFDGKVHSAESALAMKLIDKVSAFEDVLASAYMPSHECDECDEESEEVVVPEAKGAVMSEAKTEGVVIPTTATDPAVAVEFTPATPEAIARIEAGANEFAAFAADCEKLAEVLKANGCPLTLESIKSKLLACKDFAGAQAKMIELARIPTEASVAAWDRKPDPAAESKPAVATDPRAQWKALMDKHASLGTGALAAAAKENPELHRAFLKFYNPKNPNLA